MEKKLTLERIADELLKDYDEQQEVEVRKFTVRGRVEVEMHFMEDGYCNVYINNDTSFSYDYCNKSLVVDTDPKGILEGIEKVFIPRLGKDVKIRPLKWCPRCEHRLIINTDKSVEKPYYCDECNEYWYDMDA